MAGFVEVMRQAKRMCASYRNDCAGCGLANDASECPFEALPEKWPVESHRLAGVERIVMDWADKHPEPRYPTWKEWWKVNFPRSPRPICPLNFMSRSEACGTSENCNECLENPIPADIAEKLGIKPMGGTEDA